MGIVRAKFAAGFGGRMRKALGLPGNRSFEMTVFLLLGGSRFLGVGLPEGKLRNLEGQRSSDRVLKSLDHRAPSQQCHPERRREPALSEPSPNEEETNGDFVLEVEVEVLSRAQRLARQANSRSFDFAQVTVHLKVATGLMHWS